MKKLSIMITLCTIVLYIASFNAKASDNTMKNIVTDTVQTVHIDPVCKMKVKTTNAKNVVYNKTTYYFCAESCKQKFVAKPSNYIKK
ncbi:YHS domain-containing protein [Pedobacter mendelii]|uniref:TRASH domain-containing protein n=1 Tax=Pedobacter mendelii TaxID=1908240 RepID=A0ABQ2BH85_9SPHI|nr:YHS domain-containing protein [Pedobacter mendelii]GGI26068.1 hypothetical protein GCM10008119_20800 [Pedobacter mendelii]